MQFNARVEVQSYRGTVNQNQTRDGKYEGKNAGGYKGKNVTKVQRDDIN